MSYDLTLVDKDTKETIKLKRRLNTIGGNIVIGGTDEAWLNITCNYGEIFRKVLPPDGIYMLENMTAKDSLPLLLDAISKLKDDVDENYWKDTEGNARLALMQLVVIAMQCPPDSIWVVDY